MKKILAAIFLVTALACSATSGAHAATMRDLKIRDDGASVSVNVHTGGCTQRSDFDVSNVAKGTPAVVTIKRHKGDACEVFVPGGMWLTFTKSELGLASGDSVKFLEETN